MSNTFTHMKRHLLLLGSLLILSVNILQAQTIRYVKQGGSGDGSSWANASGDLQAIINTPGVTEVWVAKGTYKPMADPSGNTNPSDARFKTFVMRNGVGIYGGFAGSETELSQRDWKNNLTTLSGDFNDNDVISGSGGTLSITGNGENSYNVILNFENGLDHTALLDGFTITGGNANKGGIKHGHGGGVNNLESSPAFANCTFTGNASSSAGGGMANWGSTIVLTNCHFSKNIAGSGGGLFSTSIVPAPSKVTLTNCSFTGNYANISSGGGMHSISSGPLPNVYTLINVSFRGNYARSFGGGLSSQSSATATLSNCIFANNRSNSQGGGMYNGNCSPELTNCSFSGNTARDAGGGIHNFSNAHPMLKNCILWENSSEVAGDSPKISFSIIKGGFEGTGNFDTDPLFVDAASGDLRLQLCSPAIDAGTETVDMTQKDLDGNVRFVGHTIDMGAYEHQQPLPVITAATMPTEQVVCQNAPAAGFSVEALGEGITFQWYKANSLSEEGVLIDGATEASYTPSTATLGKTFYYVIVKNACGKRVTKGMPSVEVQACCTPPVISSVTTPVDPLAITTPVTLTIHASQTNITSASINWGDGSASQTVNNPSAVQTYMYAAPGVYTPSVTITNSCGKTSDAASTLQYVVIYDPSAGFVTGSGWITSPAGALTADPAATDRATFGFVSKYKKGASIPEGNTQFQFKAGNLSFQSTVYEWLVVSGSKAKFKGEGTINGQGRYGFMLTATDGSADLFRIKIWDKGNGDALVYDNQPGATEDSYAGTGLGGGNIVVHDGRKRNARESLEARPETSLARATLHNFPNPFTGKTTIEFTFDLEEEYTLEIYDLKGRLMTRLGTARAQAGKVNQVVWEAGKAPAGIYFARLTSKSGLQHIKLVAQ